MLQQILEDMWVDPELLEELTKEQREILFHKIREEQVRRYIVDIGNTKPKQLPPPKIKFDDYADMWEDANLEEKAKKAEQQKKDLERQRELEEMKADEEEARIMAEIEVQEQLARQKAEAERRAAELRQQEEEEKIRLAQQAEAERIAAMEREQYMTMKEAKKAAEKEAKLRKEREEKALKLAEQRKKEEEALAAEVAAREAALKQEQQQMQEQIYETRQNIRRMAKKKSQEEEKRLDKVFKEQEKIAKKAEEEQRKAAMLARKKADKSNLNKDSTLQKIAKRRDSEAAQHKKMEEVMAAQREAARTSFRSSAKKPPRPPKKGSKGKIIKDPGNVETRDSRPANEAEVVRWFQNVEMPKGVGRSAEGKWQQWFHGLISRQDAEVLLNGLPVGSFLVRVSARIWGYTLSFVDKDRFKHFLIDAADGSYSVFGAQARNHTDMNTLIKFHYSIPVSKSGTKLSQPVGNDRGPNRSLSKLIE